MSSPTTSQYAAIEALSARLGTPVKLDAATLLTERAAISGFKVMARPSAQ